MKLSSWSSHYAIREKRNLEKTCSRFLGNRSIGDIDAIALLAAVRKVVPLRPARGHGIAPHRGTRGA